MFSALMVAIRTVTKRLTTDWLIAGAAFTTIVLATALLASGPIYADAVTISALQRTLDDAPPTDANLDVSLRIFPEYYGDADLVVRETVADSFEATGADVYADVEGDAFELPEYTTEDVVALAAVRYLEDVESRTELVAGSWPEEGATRVEVAVHSGAADALAVAPGDEVELVNRRDPTIKRTVHVAGVYSLEDPSDPYWFEEPLLIAGVENAPSFRTYGPFLVSSDTLLADFTPERANASWRVLPFHAELAVDEVDGLRSSIASLGTDLDAALFESVDPRAAGASEFAVQSDLDTLLAGMGRSLTVTRSSVLALLAQLAILAGYALVLTAGLLTDTRRSETILVRSRGASPGHIASVAGFEALLLAVPAAVLGPLLASWMLRALNGVGPLAAIGMRIDPTPIAESWLLAALAATLAVGGLVWPAYRSARSFPSDARRHRRQSTMSTTQRAGVDFALVVVAVVAFWQLQVIGPEISSQIMGRFSVDPLLVLAPAVGLLAGAVLALRIVPLLARAAEWIATAGRSAVPALASWQVARRPTRYARSALLLVMAVGIGFFAASYASTWTQSQRDQAAHEVGADYKVAPNAALGSIGDLHLPNAHTGITGIETSMPVLLFGGSLGSQVGPAQFVALDATKAGSVVTIREDMGPDFEPLMAALVEARPTMASVPLPGRPNTLVIEVEATEEIPEEQEQCGPEPIGEETCFNAILRVVIQDGNQQLHRLDAGAIVENEGPISLEVPLALPGSSGADATPTYPLALVNIEIESLTAAVSSRVVEVGVGPISVGDGSGALEPVEYPMEWTDWGTSQTATIGTNLPPTITTAPSQQPNTLSLTIETGTGFAAAPTFFSIRPVGTELPETFPIVVSESFIETAFTEPGQAVRLPPLRLESATAVVVGTIESFPSIDPARGPTIILDLPTYQMLGYEPGVRLADMSSYWMAGSGDPDQIEASLASPPISSAEVTSTELLIDSLVSDPVALGTIGALAVGFVAAAVFAAVGFAVSATVSARERMVEFALLRALGLAPRQLAAWLVTEQGVLVLVSLALGTGLGWLLTTVILPLVTLTQDGTLAQPPVTIVYPWTAIVGLELAVVAVLALIVAVLTAVLRRVGLGSLLRLGEDA